MKTKQEQIDAVKKAIQQIEADYKITFEEAKKSGKNLKWVSKRKNLEIYKLKQKLVDIEYGI